VREYSEQARFRAAGTVRYFKTAQLCDTQKLAGLVSALCGKRQPIRFAAAKHAGLQRAQMTLHRDLPLGQWRRAASCTAGRRMA
jgi:hypothetical protein